MQTGARDLAHRAKPLHAGPAPQVDRDPAAAVVGGRHDRYRLLRDVEADLEALAVDLGKPVPDPRRRFVADVEVRAVRPGLVHHLVNAARDDVTRSQGAIRVIVHHELAARRVHQAPAFTAKRLRDQEALVTVVERRRVKLDELHVDAAGARAVRHRHPVSAGAGRIGRVKKDPPEASGCQDGLPGHERLDAPRLVVEHVGPDAGRRRVHVARVARMVRQGQQIDRAPAGEHGHVRLPQDGGQHRLLDRSPRRVFVVNDACDGVRSLGRQIEPAVIVPVEGHADVVDEQLLDQPGALAAEKLDGGGFAEPRAGR